MPRILVCSDSHGRADLLALAYDQQPKAEVLVFLGDGLGDAALFRYSGKEHYLVKGNCDGPQWDYPIWQEFTLADQKVVCTHGHFSQEFMKETKKIICTHGHQAFVKHSLDELLRRAKEHRADLVLYGHTHVPRVDYEDGVQLFNPGSIHAGEYGFVDVTPAGIFCQNLKVRK